MNFEETQTFRPWQLPVTAPWLPPHYSPRGGHETPPSQLEPFPGKFFSSLALPNWHDLSLELPVAMLSLA